MANKITTAEIESQTEAILRGREAREIENIRQIVVPWIEANPTEYMPWQVVLATGTEITIWCPLGAAVELEIEAGYGENIKARSY
jgi:hypothetical protein